MAGQYEIFIVILIVIVIVILTIIVIFIDLLIAIVIGIGIFIVTISLEMQHRWLQPSGARTPPVVVGASKLREEREPETVEGNLEGKVEVVVVQGVE